MINDITDGKRPSRPTDPIQNQWLRNRVWDTITICWREEPVSRCELSILYDVFSKPSPHDTQPDKPGDLNVQNRKLRIAEMS
jgi:hypothetical protein